MDDLRLAFLHPEDGPPGPLADARRGVHCDFLGKVVEGDRLRGLLGPAEDDVVQQRDGQAHAFQLLGSGLALLYLPRGLLLDPLPGGPGLLPHRALVRGGRQRAPEAQAGAQAARGQYGHPREARRRCLWRRRIRRRRRRSLESALEAQAEAHRGFERCLLRVHGRQLVPGVHLLILRQPGHRNEALAHHAVGQHRFFLQAVVQLQMDPLLGSVLSGKQELLIPLGTGRPQQLRPAPGALAPHADPKVHDCRHIGRRRGARGGGRRVAGTRGAPQAAKQASLFGRGLLTALVEEPGTLSHLEPQLAVQRAVHRADSARVGVRRMRRTAAQHTLKTPPGLAPPEAQEDRGRIGSKRSRNGAPRLDQLPAGPNGTAFRANASAGSASDLSTRFLRGA
eukprot:scaffold1159_cov215-Pinguiococcus_pyrenoidosus.AAC.12